MLPPFFNFNFSSLSGIATCTALRAIRRFRRQYCSRCSNSDKYTLLWYFLNFSSVFREILRGWGLFHVTPTCKHLCYIVWKGYLPPFDPALKGIKFPFAACKKELDTACKIQKIRENTRVLHAVVGSRIPSCSLQKGSLIAFRAIAKVNQMPFRANCMRNPRIACNADTDSNIPLGDLNLKFTK